MKGTVCRWFVFALPVLVSACSDPVDAPTRNLRRAIDMVATCVVAGELADCSDPEAVASTLWILDADRNALAVLDLSSGKHLDTNPFVPGFNAFVLGVDLVDLDGAPDSEAVFVLSREGKELIRVDTSTLERDRQPLDCLAEAFSIVAAGPLVDEGTGPVALVACPDPAGLAVVSLTDGFGETDASDIPFIPVAGRPVNLDVADDGSVAFVVHRTDLPMASPRLAHVSRVDLATGAVDRAGIGSICSDGLDNDEDGLVDNDDPGCSGPDDGDETQDVPGICADGKDNDGDGFVDMVDPDCGDDPAFPFSEFHLVPWPTCMNLKDDDGDGLTDAPDDPDCYGPTWGAEFTPSPGIIGRPSISPDGSWVYVPVANPHSVVVFGTDPFQRIPITAADGPSPNPLLERLGARDLWLSIPPVEVIMNRTQAEGDGDGDGAVTSAFVSLSSGQLVRVLVDDEQGASVHGVELAEEQLKSTAGQPVLRVGGEVVDRTVDLHPEYPSFGPRNVNAVPGEADDVFEYYGIVFNQNPELELSETWSVTREGIIPGGEGNYGFFLRDTGTLVDPTVDYCAIGVLAGDILVVEPAPPACLEETEEGVSNLCEYGIGGVQAQELVLVEMEGGGSLDLLDALPDPITWVVRVSDAWTVVGSFSGFLHNRTEAAGECVEDADADSRFTGRAFTSLPLEGDRIGNCPPLSQDPEIDWRTFSNHAFHFNLFPGCLTDENLESTLLQAPRDMELSFVMVGGATPLVVGTGGVLKGLTIVGSDLYFADSTSGAVFQADTGTLEIEKTYY